MEDVVVVLIAAANCWSQVVGTLPREQYIGYLLEEKKDPIYYWFSSTYCNNYKYIANYCNYCCFSIIANYCNYCQLLQLLPIIANYCNYSLIHCDINSPTQMHYNIVPYLTLIHHP